MITIPHDVPINAPKFDSAYETMITADQTPNTGVRLGFLCNPAKPDAITLVLTNTLDSEMLCDPLFGKAILNRNASLYCTTSKDTVFESSVSFKLAPNETLVWPLSNIPSGLFVCSLFCGELTASTLPGVVTGGVICNPADSV